jgi:hypothetical protein
MLQFCGDWLKDKKSDQDNDTKLAKLKDDLGSAVASAISDANKKSIEALANETYANKTAIDSATGSQSAQVVTKVRNDLKPIIGKLGRVSQDAKAALSSTNTVLQKVDRQLHPFKSIAWSWEYEFNQESPQAKLIISQIVEQMKPYSASSFYLPRRFPLNMVDESLDLQQTNRGIATTLVKNSRVVVTLTDGTSHDFFSSALQAPSNFENDPNGTTNLSCFVPKGGSYATIRCALSVYPDAPVIDLHAPRSEIRYLDQLAGRSLRVAVADLNPMPHVLRLRRICLHITNEALCSSTRDDLKPVAGALFEEFEIQFPNDLNSILSKLTSGTLDRTPNPEATRDTHIITLPE